jgi:hypothetical protein
MCKERYPPVRSITEWKGTLLHLMFQFLFSIRSKEPQIKVYLQNKILTHPMPHPQVLSCPGARDSNSIRNNKRAQHIQSFHKRSKHFLHTYFLKVFTSFAKILYKVLQPLPRLSSKTYPVIQPFPSIPDQNNVHSYNTT